MAAERKPKRSPVSGVSATRRQRLKSISGYWTEAAGREFERLLYQRIRLAIMSLLAVNESLSFSELRDLLQTSDGNLSVHARKLEEAGYVVCEKRFEGRVPKTNYRLTTRGRQALERYLSHMEALIQATRT